MNNQILEQAKLIARHGDEINLIAAEDMILEYLKDNPKNIEAWLLLITIEWNCPLEDPDRILEYTNNALSCDSTNPYALLFLAALYNTFLGGINAEVYYKLCLAKTDDLEIKAMIEVAKSRYFKNHDIKKYEQALELSIQYSENQQNNYTSLAVLYFNQGRIEEGINLLKKGIANVKSVGAKWDEASIERWCDYYYKGIQIPQWMYDDLYLLLNDSSKY